MKRDHVAIWAVNIELMRTFYEQYFVSADIASPAAPP